MTPAQFATPVIDAILLIGPMLSFIGFLLSFKKESQANLVIISPFLLFSSIGGSESVGEKTSMKNFSIRNCLLFQFKMQKFKYLRINRSIALWNVIAKSTVRFWLPLFYMAMKGKSSNWFAANWYYLSLRFEVTRFRKARNLGPRLCP